MQTNHDDRGDVVKLSEEIIDALVPLLNQELQRSADVGKWALGALLTINGGAILALLSSEARFADPISPGAMFAAGMILALGSAAALRFTIRTEVNNARRVLRSARDVINNVDGAPTDANQLRTVWQESVYDKVLKWLPAASEACSALVFLIGAIWAIGTIDPGKAANKHRCDLLQGDMLSASSRRTDSRDLFVALGCRPQGDGSVYAKPRTPALPHQDRTRGDRTPVASPAASVGEAGASEHQGPGRAG